MRIIYIIGAGRSGTTLLDILLGNQQGVFSAGELNRFALRNGVPHSARNDSVSDFWVTVNEKIGGVSTSVRQTSKQLEYHTGWFWKLFVAADDFQGYMRYNKRLFESIGECSDGAQIIVDSSKYPMRAKFLAQLFGDQISFVYLQRNPLDVVRSFGKKEVEQPSKGFFAAHAYILAVNVLATVILHFLKDRQKFSIISYDELVMRPTYVFQKLSDDLDLNLNDVLGKLNQGEKFQVGKLFDGNRLRSKDEIALNLKLGRENVQPSVLNSILLQIHRLLWYKF